MRSGPSFFGPSDEFLNRFPALQHLDDHPGLDVFLEALMDKELLAPFDVVPDRLHVDARAGDVQIVENLHRFQLEQSRAAEPRQDDVLSHLAVWAGGRAHRAGRRTAQELERQVDVGARLPESRCREIEDSFARRPLMLDALEQHRQRHRGERRRFVAGLIGRLGHGISSRALCSRAACSVALARISSASTRVATPLRTADSPSTSTSITLMVGVNATCQGSMVS